MPLLASDGEGKARDIHGIGWQRKDGTYMKVSVSFLEMICFTILEHKIVMFLKSGDSVQI